MRTHRHPQGPGPDTDDLDPRPKTPRGHRHRFHHHPEPGFGGPEDGGPPRGRRHGPGRGGPGRGRRGRAPRGDVRTAVLLLLSDEPMHGYQLMQAIAERSGGRWTPSPGAIYPAINQLEDEGLVTVTADAGRRVVGLTDAGRAYVDEQRRTGIDPFAAFAGATAGPDLRGLLEQLHVAARLVARTGSDGQVEAAAAILGEARRGLYLLLADGPDATGTAPDA